MSLFKRRAPSAPSVQTIKDGVTPPDLLRIISEVEAGVRPVEHESDGFPSDVVGLSGRAFRTLVSELVRALGSRGAYLEIGSYLGRTLCTSALRNPNVRHIGVDDFSQVNEGGTNREIFSQFADQLDLQNFEFYEQDFFEFLADRTLARVRDIAVYYYDASHDYRSQVVALLHGAEQTVRGGVMIVDDCNYSHVRVATNDFCDLHPDWVLAFERYTERHPMKADAAVRARLEEGWWNGVHVLIHDPEHTLERLPRQPEPDINEFFLRQHASNNLNTSSVSSRITAVSD